MTCVRTGHYVFLGTVVFNVIVIVASMSVSIILLV